MFDKEGWSMMKAFFGALVLLGSGWAWSATSADEILAASDAIRNPGRSFSVTVTLTEFQAGKQVDTSTLTSYSRTQQQGGQFASLIRFVLPTRDTGKLMLKNGNDMCSTIRWQKPVCGCRHNNGFWARHQTATSPP